MYDYIIVGGGSAGCVLANRLSSNPQHRVCLVEAGPVDSNPFIRIPLGIVTLMRNKRLNWQFYTEPEPNLRNQRKFWPRGKTLGGSSAINAMIYNRGNRWDYDHWESLGNEGWGYDSVLPFFKKSQHQENGENDFHGVGGPLNVADVRSDQEITKVFVEAGKQAGFTFNPDFNGADQEGIGYYQVTQKQGQRCSSAEAFIRPAENRPNLTIVTDALVERVLLNGKRAVGISYRQFGVSKEIHASAEVILSAGAIGSPQLLMLSGIGHAKELKEQDISVSHDLPGVGKNLQDHLDVLLVQRCRKPVTIGISLPGLIHNLPAIKDYFLHRRGLFTSNAAESGGFLKTSSSEAIPDVQFHFTNALLDGHGMTNKPMFGHGYSLHVCDLRPKSRGEIRLRCNNPSATPKIFANYLSAPEDLETLKKGVRIGEAILAAKAFDDYRGSWYSPQQPIDNEESLESFIRQKAETVYHPVGTCKMGKDDLAVVDEQLRVHGMEGLRVIDASIMPTLVGGNTNAPSIMIGEKGAHMILSGKT